MATHGALRQRRTLGQHIQQARRIAQQDRIGRVALFMIWLGLAIASSGTSTLQWTFDMDHRQLL